MGNWQSQLITSRWIAQSKLWGFVFYSDITILLTWWDAFGWKKSRNFKAETLSITLSRNKFWEISGKVSWTLLVTLRLWSYLFYSLQHIIGALQDNVWEVTTRHDGFVRRSCKLWKNFLLSAGCGAFGWKWREMFLRENTLSIRLNSNFLCINFWA